MTNGPDSYRAGRMAGNLEDIDRELARLAQMCGVRLLRPGVIERILHGDDSVCGTTNKLAFRKLHDLLMMHFAVRARSAEALGEARATAIEYYVVQRLKARFPELAADWPPV